jgi:hypothetical protein
MKEKSSLFDGTVKSPRFFRWLKDMNCRSYLKRRTAEETLQARQHILQLLKGSWGTEPCWTDEKLRNHIVESVDAAFAIDDFWRTQILISFYLDKKLTTSIVDQQISDARDIHDGAAPQGLCGVGKGWNPVSIMRCIKKATGFTYAFVPLYQPIWQSRFSPESNTPDDVFDKQTISPLVSYEGTRGCVRKLVLAVEAPVDAEDECLSRFLGLYKKITPDFFAGNSDKDLRTAINARADFASVVGDVATRFTWRLPQTDGGERAKRVAQLFLSHP